MSMNRGMDKEDVVHIYNGTLVIKRTGIGPFAETWGRDSYCSWILLATGAHSHNLLGLQRQRNFPAKLPAWFPLADVLGTEVLYVEADPIPCLLIFRVGLYLSPLYIPPCLPGGVPRTPVWSRGGMNSFGLPSLPWWEIHHQGLGSLSLLAGVLGGVRPYHSVFPFSFWDHKPVHLPLSTIQSSSVVSCIVSRVYSCSWPRKTGRDESTSICPDWKSPSVSECAWLPN